MSQSGFSISEYHDIKPIYQKLDKLVSLPLQHIKPEAMDGYLNYYKTKCTKSREVYDKARQYIPGGVQHNLAFNYPFPLTFTKAEGAYLYDADGNKYIDFLQAGGPTVLGSNYPSVKEKAIENNQKAIFLNVNKYNNAIHFYTKLGFTKVKDEVIDIGNGYVMDDYVMEVAI